MCLAVLVDHDTDRPLGELIREEICDATATALHALVSLAAGPVLTVVPTAVFGYLVAGAALDAIGVDPTALVRSPPEER